VLAYPAAFLVAATLALDAATGTATTAAIIIGELVRELEGCPAAALAACVAWELMPLRLHCLIVEPTKRGALGFFAWISLFALGSFHG
jgi:hypothetical protein